VQEALIRALSAWEDDAPSDPEGWLITVSWRAFIDMARSDAARRDREIRRGTIRPPISCRAPTTPCTSTSCVPIPN
jgi:predicted RNA polymerase sigma factor